MKSYCLGTWQQKGDSASFPGNYSCYPASGSRGHFCCEDSGIKKVIVKQNCVS